MIIINNYNYVWNTAIIFQPKMWLPNAPETTECNPSSSLGWEIKYSPISSQKSRKNWLDQSHPSETKFFSLPLHVVKQSLRNFYEQNCIKTSELSILENPHQIQKTYIDWSKIVDTWEISTNRTASWQVKLSILENPHEILSIWKTLIGAKLLIASKNETQCFCFLTM